mmetsp:Transcript_35172/g.53902  ORF Transcript_35172/g.53902 Transcript_35172/m.53902 type:complete len:106 (+) Transcript_35172:49-366(+)
MNITSGSHFTNVVSTLLGGPIHLANLEINFKTNSSLIGTGLSSDADDIFDMQMTMGFEKRIGHFMFPKWTATTEKAFYLTLAFVCAMCFLMELLTHCKKKIRATR